MNYEMSTYMTIDSNDFIELQPIKIQVTHGKQHILNEILKYG